MAINKVINSQSQEFQPVLTDTLVLDAVPTVNSFNSVTSDGVARAIAGASGEVPQVTESDNGKILTAVYDEGGAAVEWADAQGGIPESSSADEGKVLTVDANGDPEWAEAQSGASYTAGNGIYISGQNVISSNTASSDFVYGQTSAIQSSNYNNNNSFWYPYDTEGISAPSTIKCIRYIDIGYQNYTLHWVTGTSVAAYVSTFSVSGRYGVTVGTILQLPDRYRSSDWVGGVLPTGVSPIYLTIAGSEGGTAPNGEQVVDLRADASTPYFVNLDNQTTMYLKNPLPSFNTSTDAGKVLKVNAGATAVEWASESTELPAVTGNAGKVLTVNSGATGVEWAAAQGGLPSSTSSDNGKVLTVTDTSGTLGWRAIPSSYASFNTTFNLIDNGDHHSWSATVNPMETIDLPDGVYAYRVEGYFVASAAVDDVYNIEVRVGNNSIDYKAIGLQSDSDNAVSIRTSGILNIDYDGAVIYKSLIYVTVNPAKSSSSSVVSTAEASLKLKLAKL